MADSHEAIEPVCPAWCTSRHGETAGEEDLVHVSAPVLVGNTSIVLCVTIDPYTGTEDGPYVLFGNEEYTIDETATLVGVLTQLSVQARTPTPRAEV